MSWYKMFWRTGIGLWSLQVCLAYTYNLEGSDLSGGVYVGCFAKNSEELPFFWWPFQSLNSSLGRCYVACQNAFFTYAAISGDSMQCYCGNSGHDIYGEATSCFDCIMEKQKFKCAPEDAMGVYQTEWKAMDNRYMGCWYGSPTLIGAQVEKALITSSSNLTVDTCVNLCRKKFIRETEFSSNNIYIAIKGGKQCFCGRDLKSEKDDFKGMGPAISGCDLPCTGNSSQLCGGEMISNFYSIYRAVCSDGHFGMECKPCNCSPGFTCDKTTGQCYSLCDDCNSDCGDGYFGPTCYPCNCPGELPCNKHTGLCPNSRCGKGWTKNEDEICTGLCPNNKFGQECSESCNCLNSFACDRVNGKCPFGACAAGYQGPTCSDACPPNRFGEDCRRKCACKFCDSVSGLCVENCVPGMPCRLQSSSDCQLLSLSHFLMVLHLLLAFVTITV